MEKYAKNCVFLHWLILEFLKNASVESFELSSKIADLFILHRAEVILIIWLFPPMLQASQQLSTVLTQLQPKRLQRLLKVFMKLHVNVSMDSYQSNSAFRGHFCSFCFGI